MPEPGMPQEDWFEAEGSQVFGVHILTIKHPLSHASLSVYCSTLD